LNKQFNVALIGNPNTGKSTLFNALTGLNQKIGNFSGVTVERKTGKLEFNENLTASLIDLPGTYSLYPRSADEHIALEILNSTKNPDYPNVVVVVVDATNLKRNLLLLTQLIDLQLPVVLALNMMDVAQYSGIEINVPLLSEKLGVPVVAVTARDLQGIEDLKNAIVAQFENPTLPTSTIHIHGYAPEVIDEIKAYFQITNDYAAFELAHHYHELSNLTQEKKDAIEAIGIKYNFNANKTQVAETIERYNYINDILSDSVRKNKPVALEETRSNTLDAILTHRIFGLLIFFVILFGVFQSIFNWSQYPMNVIENAFISIQNSLTAILPEGILTNLIIGGILPGMSGVLIFLPQIAVLFLFIAILEDTGYMARVTFMMDRLMKNFGLNGKSVVPLISGIACAVPAIMSARSIENWKDRLITIFVTPFMSCSARLPVYTLLISLVVPNKFVFGFLSLQGLILMAMYLLGFVSALLAGWLLKLFIKTKSKSYFLMELPVYRMPRWSNVGITIFNKARTFVVEAGKVILAVSIILWVLATFGPSKDFEAIEKKYATMPSDSTTIGLDASVLESKIKAEKLEASYAGLLGKFIEPAIKPLGYDWKIGIALVTSFAAREVFVGTMSTIYSVQGDGEHLETVREKMLEARNPETGELTFSFATVMSLMIFYAFAMQCMSTFAVVYRETNGIKWPLIQLFTMTAFAYLAAFAVYQFLS
jgi:ferrous iron transport protein B